ncbi:dTMP kinase [Candidatus Gottesmanbacteria bacterium RBG_16_37_8]|uniref:Thymidylate kinase n=1 Tax=Candidatus Gottesmanbacteria bacterium RBG_16_37_8 TaxID=1798371 RepID=A0A1F5YPN9_9BACT|nr:MAG: dTMP kinase [Candidatus Gottesmanbacteria bacterium RBG_16_37_8]
MKKRMFITFEGLEGSGKSTQAGLLASRLKEEKIAIKVTREPGGSRIGELIRQITHSKENVDLTAVAEAYLMAASRAQHVREIIRPALDVGLTVICDRYIDSSLAYQGYGRKLGVEVIYELNKLAVDGVFPDLTVLLDIELREGFARRNGTDKIDRLDLQQSDFYRRVYQGYKKLAEKYKKRYFVVDSSCPINDVADKIWNKVKNFNLKGGVI